MSWFRWLGALTAALSLYSVALHLYHFPVITVFVEVINYYRAIAYPFIGLIEKVIALVGWHIHLPRDLTVLYLLAGASFLRFDLYTETDRGRAATPDYILIPASSDLASANEKKGLLFRATRPVVFTLMWPMIFLIFIVFLLDKGARHGALMLLRYLSTGFAIEILRTLGIFVLFVAVNGATPSLFN